jgi:hypothetical protein
MALAAKKKEMQAALTIDSIRFDNDTMTTFDITLPHGHIHDVIEYSKQLEDDWGVDSSVHPAKPNTFVIQLSTPQWVGLKILLPPFYMVLGGLIARGVAELYAQY